MSYIKPGNIIAAGFPAEVWDRDTPSKEHPSDLIDPVARDFERCMAEVQAAQQYIKDTESAWLGSAGFGGISVSGNAVETAIAVTQTWYQVTVFDTETPANGVTPDATEDHLKILTAGDYFFDLSMSFSGASTDLIKYKLAKNNGATDLSPIMERKLGAGGDTGVVSVEAIATMAANDTVEVWVYNDSDADNITVISAILIAHRLN